MKAQGTMEFVMIFVILLLALSLGAWMSLQKSAEISRAKLALESGMILDDVAGKINTALLEGSGFRVKAFLPDKISGIDYSIAVRANTVVISFSSGIDYFKKFLTQNITGSFVRGVNIIENLGGTIRITQ